MSHIRVKINKAGLATYQVEGISGMRCTEVTGFLDRALGATTDQRTLTAEAYQIETEQENEFEVQ